MARTKSWSEVRGQLALNEARVDTYRRVMEAEMQIGELLLRHGVTDEQLDQALVAAHPDASSDEPEEEVYLSSLTRFVAALGGHLELQAVFPERSITILRTDAGKAEPESDAQPAGDHQAPGSQAT